MGKKKEMTTISVDKYVVKAMKMSAIMADMTLGEYVEYVYSVAEKVAKNGK